MVNIAVIRIPKHAAWHLVHLLASEGSILLQLPLQCCCGVQAVASLLVSKKTLLISRLLVGLQASGAVNVLICEELTCGLLMQMLLLTN